MKEYKKARILFSPFNIDMISGILWDNEIEGLTELDDSIEIYYSDENNFNFKMLEQIFEDLKSRNIIEMYRMAEEDVENKNWNEEWEKNLQIYKPGNVFVIKPDIREYSPTEEEILIEISPKMSFGTGDHPTTQMMLQYIENNTPADKTILDLGCGTGILAIAAAKTGAKHITALDMDEWSILNVKENIKLNNVENVIDVKQQDATSLGNEKYGIIYANINKHILLDIADNIYNKLNPSGDLYLSGILEQDEADITERYCALGFELLEKLQNGEWLALKLKKGA